MTKSSKRWQLLWFGAYLTLGGFFGYVFYVRYWEWRDCIAEAASSCVTADGANLIGGGRFWLIPSVIFFIAALRRLLKYANG